MDRSDMLGDLFAFLAHHDVRFCAIGGMVVCAYADPVVTLDLDLVLETSDPGRIEPLLSGVFSAERFTHSINLARTSSDLWAASDPSRRTSKRQEDLADIARLLEVQPRLRANVPQPILDRLI